MKQRAKIGVWVIVIAGLVVLFAVTGARRSQKEEVKSIESVQKAEGIPVDVVKAQAVTLENWKKFVGVAEGYEQVNLTAPFRTRISRVHVALGQELKPGKVLISLDPYDPAWAGMNLQTARAGYETARQDSIRVEELFKTGAVSQQDLDHTRAATDGARAHYTTARRAVELDTPISGMVTALNVNAGDYAVSDQTLATVASYDRIRVPLEVSETDRALLQVGQPVRLTSGERVLEGRVVKVALSADPTSRLFAIELVIENSERLLKPGALVAPEVLVARTDARPVIPPDAIIKSDGEEHVFVVDQSGAASVARLRQIVRGIESGTMTAIDQGITPGDVVVVWGQNNLEDGARVKIHEDLTAGTYKATH
jgi:membrane fusion protein (multidrug efflux system)